MMPIVCEYSSMHNLKLLAEIIHAVEKANERDVELFDYRFGFVSADSVALYNCADITGDKYPFGIIRLENVEHVRDLIIVINEWLPF